MSRSTQTDKPSPRILAFLKAPISGSVKTRLAREIGNEEATRIYRMHVERQIAALPPDWPVEIHFAPPDAESMMSEWLGSEFSYIPQTGRDLGERMHNAVKSAFADGAEKVICIGGDCPDLGEKELRESEEKLHQGNDLVFGPTFDGGYYLMGLSKPCDEVFESIPWSSSKTLTASLLHAKRFGRSFTLLETKVDVDDLDDWEKAKHLFALAK